MAKKEVVFKNLIHHQENIQEMFNKILELANEEKLKVIELLNLAKKLDKEYGIYITPTFIIFIEKEDNGDIFYTLKLSLFKCALIKIPLLNAYDLNELNSYLKWLGNNIGRWYTKKHCLEQFSVPYVYGPAPEDDEFAAIEDGLEDTLMYNPID